MSEERLTYVDENGEILFCPVDFPEDKGLTITQLADDKRYKALEEIAERLANREQYCELLEEKLKQYRDLEEQGRLVITPIAVGDMAYHVIVDDVVEPPVYISEHKIMDVSAKAVYFADDWWRLDEMAEMNAFLTKEEAEEKLRELEKVEGK